MEYLSLPNLLLLAGTGRNSGKTTMACSIIKKFCSAYPIIAVKISPHIHEIPRELLPVINRDDLYIAAETDYRGPKDSSRMLAAGARKSFFVMCSDDRLNEALQQILSLIDPNDIIICESGGLRNVVTPGLFIMMNRKDQVLMKPSVDRYRKLCDKWIIFDGERFDFSPDALLIQNSKWKLAE